MRNTPHYMGSFEGVNWNGRAMIALEPGPVYEELIVQCNFDVALIRKVEVVLNGDSIYDVTGRTLDGRAFTGLVTKPTDNLVLRIYLPEQPQGGAAEPVLDGHVLTSSVLAAGANGQMITRQRLVVPRIQTFTMNSANRGENTFRSLPQGPRIRRIHFQGGDISKLRIFRDRLEVFDATKALNDFLLKRYERAPQTGIYHFDPIATGFVLADLFQTAGNTLELRVDSASGGNIELLVESVEAA